MVSPSIHASAVLIGRHAVLIRGPSGSGKSRLALALIDTAARGPLPFARLVADDRALLESAHGRLLVRPAPALAGIIEVRGLGLRTLPYEPLGMVGLVVELGAEGTRMPDQAEQSTRIEGLKLPQISAADTASALPLLLAWQRTVPARS